MKSYVVCSLALFQIICMQGAAEQEIQKDGYRIYQSEKSKAKGTTFVLDGVFDLFNPAAVLKWSDVQDVPEVVRVVALVAADNPVSEDEQTKMFENLKPLFNVNALKLFAALRKSLDDHHGSSYYTLDLTCDEKPYEAFGLSSLQNIKALALHMQLQRNNVLPGCAEVLFDAQAEKRWQHYVGVRNWYSSLHVSKYVPRMMGSLDQKIAESGVRGLKVSEEDLHMLIFDRNPALVLERE